MMNPLLRERIYHTSLFLLTVFKQKQYFQLQVEPMKCKSAVFSKNMQCAEIYGHVEWLQGCDCVDAITGARDNVTVAAPRTGGEGQRGSCMGRLLLR